MDKLVAPPGKKSSVKEYDAEWRGRIENKKESAALLADGVSQLAKEQDKL
jgi:hypothetical protein